MQGVTDRCIHAGHPALTTEMGNGPQCCLLPAAFLRNCSICGCLIHCESKPDPEKGRQCTLLMGLPSSDVPLGSLTEAGPCHACPQCGQLCEVCVGRRALMHTGTIFEGLKISSLANFQQKTIKDLILPQVGLLQQRAVYGGDRDSLWSRGVSHDLATGLCVPLSRRVDGTFPENGPKSTRVGVCPL